MSTDFIVNLNDSKSKTVRQWRLHRNIIRQLPYYDNWFKGPFGDEGTSTLEASLVSGEGLDFVWAWLYRFNGVEEKKRGVVPGPYLEQPNESVQKISAQVDQALACRTKHLRQKTKPTSTTCFCTIKSISGLAAHAYDSLKVFDFFSSKEDLEAVARFIEKVINGRHAIDPFTQCQTLLPIISRYRGETLYDMPVFKEIRTRMTVFLAQNIQAWKRPVAQFDDKLREELIQQIPPTVESWLKLRKLRSIVGRSTLRSQWEEILKEAENAVASLIPMPYLSECQVEQQIPSQPIQIHELLAIGNIERRDIIELFVKMSTLKRNEGVLHLENCEAVLDFLVGRVCFPAVRYFRKIKSKESSAQAAAMVTLKDVKRALREYKELEELRECIPRVEDVIQTRRSLRGDNGKFERLVTE